MPPESFLSDFRGHFILAHLHLLFNIFLFWYWSLFILKRYTPLLLLPDLLHYSVLQVYTLHVFSLAHYWHIAWQLTIVLIKKRNYGFIFNRICGLYLERYSLLLAFLQMHRLVREDLKKERRNKLCTQHYL